MLQNNSLSSLPSTLLSPLDGLLLLNLSSNLLTDSTLRPILRDQVKLIALDLSHNRLAKVGNNSRPNSDSGKYFLKYQVGRGMLSNLGQLQILNLGHNQIDHIEVGKV